MRVFLASILLFGSILPGMAAEILAGGALFGGPTQTTTTCYFYNTGGRQIELITPQITNSSGFPLTLTINQCEQLFNNVLPAGRMCGITADVPNNLPFSCRATISPNKTNVRGQLQVYHNQTVLETIQLR